MSKYFITFILFLFLNCNFAHGLENKILLKIDKEIITTIDIAKEISYLQALNKDVNKLEQNILIGIAKNNLIKDKIKQIELLKNIDKLEIRPDHLKFLIKNIYLKIGLADLEEFKEYLRNYDLKIETVKEKILIDSNWKQFIFIKYKNQIKIDKESIVQEIKNRKSKIYKLSEILFTLKANEKLETKYNLLNKSISEKGFVNTAVIFSIADSSRKGGNLGWVNSSAISAKILKKLSLLNVNDHTDPIIVPGGFLILKIEDYKEEEINYDIDKEIEKVVNIKVDEQLNVFSNLYLNKLKKDLIVNEL
tara:strand:- start:1011 stop:1928 length:918 start_codon:yes stop_codon:yes gene_type:complete